MKLKASFTLLVVFVLALIAAAQNITEFNMHRLEKIKRVAQPDFKKTTKKKGHLTRDDWQKLIDERWGQGLPTDQKLQIFDTFWSRIDRNYAGFPNSDVDWNALREKYRPEVEEGVSRGRFNAIINHLCLALQEAHTLAWDNAVRNDVLEPGVPLMVGYAFYDNSHFGAALTPLPDSSLLVYRVVENHPLGLELGDRVLGYDGQPWKSLYKELLSYELPLTYPTYGTTKESEEHRWLATAGSNWHLFDTIDIVKYSSGDTLHLPTSLLVGHNNMKLFGSEQMPIAGIDFPDYENKEAISWGIVEGTNIGYVYTYVWEPEYGSQRFQTAIIDLMYNHRTEGIIIDTRFDQGGIPSMAMAGLKYLFNFDVYKLVTDKRTDPNSHLGLTQADPAFVCSYESEGFVATSDIYDKPIAILTGPGSFSVGDRFPFIASLHPYARIFGKPTNGTFCCYDASAGVSLATGWFMLYANYNSYSVDNPHNYLTDSAPRVDEEVWLEQDDVANGEDTVVKRAIEWIQNKVYPYDAISKTYNTSGQQFQSKVHLHNPNNHAVVLWSYLNNADHSAVLDSAQLALSDSNLYSGSLEIPPIEGDFSLTYKSVDLDDGAIQVLPFVDRFTTRGPVSVDHYEVTSADTVPNPGDLLEVKLYMKNGGRRASIQNIKIALLAIDPCVGPWRLNLRTLDSLRAGEVKDHSGAFMILFDSGCEAPAVHPLQVNIYENDKLHWIDTLNIELKPDITGIADRHATPNVFDLQQNYPNPFNPATKIEFALAKREKVKLEVFDLLGTQVATLVDETLKAGAHSAVFEANNLPAGLYFYRIQAGEFVQTKKLTILR